MNKLIVWQDFAKGTASVGIDFDEEHSYEVSEEIAKEILRLMKIEKSLSNIIELLDSEAIAEGEDIPACL